METTRPPESLHILLRWLCLLALMLLTDAGALTLDVKAVKLNADQQASLQRYVAETLPTRTFDVTIRKTF